MGLFSKPAKSENGYGDKDRELADALRSASTKKEADEIAKADGHKDAADAADWLKGRS